ncbi:hypothetical protein EON82_14665 [bacterium]|nr:MAG: hypothetical protein EON82_14665 [bacterium]
MPETVYAAFSDAMHAESAAGALLDHGIPASDISLVLNEEAKKKVENYTDSAAMNSQPTIVAAGSGGLGTFDPLGNETRLTGATPPIPGGNLFPVGETAEVNADLNPALDDYPRTGTDSPTELSSRPPNSKYDWNADLDKKSYNDDYNRAQSEKVDDEIRLEGDRDRARVDPASVNKENDPGTVGPGGVTPHPAVAQGHVADVRPVEDPERAAKAGVTTTTIQDAAKGAAKGVGYGLGIGALAAVASIAIPGFGLVLGGGALAAAVAGLAASAGAGAVAGGVVGYLKDQGVPADEIPAYQEAYEHGGAILSVVINPGTDLGKVQELLRKYGASNVRPFGYVA